MQRRQPADVAFDVLGMLGGQIAIAMNGYRSGDTGAATAEIEVPRWQAWLAMLFPALRLCSAATKRHASLSDRR